eukprot:scaffold302_cov397-Prasinococcus_capsulatus_cf.AAC.4
MSRGDGETVAEGMVARGSKRESRPATGSDAGRGDLVTFTGCPGGGGGGRIGCAARRPGAGSLVPGHVVISERAVVQGVLRPPRALPLLERAAVLELLAAYANAGVDALAVVIPNGSPFIHAGARRGRGVAVSNGAGTGAPRP